MATEKLDGKGFTLKGLAPDATYVIQVKAIPEKGDPSEWSQGIKFNTNGKDVAPPNVTNLTAGFDGTGFVSSWDGSAAKAQKDFAFFRLTITSSVVPSVTKIYDVQAESFSLDRDSILWAFGQLVNSITIEVKSVDRSGNQSTGVSETAGNTPPAAPTNVSVSAESMGYLVSWDAPEESDYFYSKIYESSTQGGTYNHIESVTATPASIKVVGYDTRYVKVSHVDTFGGESDLAPTTGLEVTPINPVSVDADPPDQRTAISYSSGIGSIIVSWTNPTDSATNSDVAGIIIRYAKTASPTNYTWVTVPFTFSNPLTTATVENLLPLTSYDFSVATFDQTQNRTSYSSTYTITTSADATPPPQPASPTVTAGTSAGGPLVIRVTQESVENIVGNPALPLDTSYFKVFMLDHSYTTEPALGVSADANASEIGTITAAFNGGTSQNNFYVPLVDQETRYFYTRAVDTSGNISDASPASQSSSMVVIDNAYISDLSADKITAGRLNATEYIQVGTSSEQVTIESTASLGKIYSGVGTYNNSNTGFYVDSSGKFSLKDRLIFDGTDLALEGSITATGGSFTGNVQLDGGSLFAGASSSSGARVIMNENGLTAYNSSNSSTFTLNAATGAVTLSGYLQVGGAASDVNNSGSGTYIVGDKIQTGSISSNGFSWTPENTFSSPGGGTRFDLDTGQIIGEKIRIFSDGTINMLGTITSTGLTVKSSSQQETYNIYGYLSTVSSVYSILSEDGADLLFTTAGTTNPSKIRWLDADTNGYQQRGTIGWEISADAGGSSYPETLVIRAAASYAGNTPGRIRLDAQAGASSDGEVTIDAANIKLTEIPSVSLGAGASILAINSVGRIGTATASELQIEAGYINATDVSTTTNRIKYGTANVGDAYTTANNGDIYLKYV